MQKLFVSIQAMLRRARQESDTSSDGGLKFIAPPTSFRLRQVSGPAPSRVYLRLLNTATSTKQGKLASLLGASIGTVVIAGFTGPALGQSGEEACAFVAELRSPYTVERILRQFPNDPCVPVMLAAIPAELLHRVDLELIQDLPPSQLGKLSDDLLEDLGIATRSVDRYDNDRDSGSY